MSSQKSGYFVYVDDTGHRWALKLPPAVGNHPDLGFVPLGSERLPVLKPARYTYVGAIRPRHIGLALRQQPPFLTPAKYGTVPVGTREAAARLPRRITLPEASGEPVEWEVSSRFGESRTESRLPWRETAQVSGS